MKILIPSRSRHGKLKTLQAIPERFEPIVYVAEEQREDYELYNPGVEIRCVNTLNDKLGRKLELMAKDVDDEIILLCDDDFTFFRRVDIWESKLEQMTDSDFDDMFDQIQTIFDSQSNVYGVGVSMRQGNNNLDVGGELNTRLNGCIAYRRELFLSVEHDRINPMNDFDVNLQLLRKGYDNFVLSEFCYNQGDTNDPGGSSDYRTLETQAQAAYKLQELHPQFVTVVDKFNKGGTLAQRKDVRVSWKKARKSASK